MTAVAITKSHVDEITSAGIYINIGSRWSIYIYIDR